MSEANTPAKKTRESRTNHAAAKAHPITDAASAQRFCDAAVAATKNDETSQSMFNGSGFVSPLALDNQDVPNRLRMGAQVINSLAASVESDGAEGTAARNALTILASYASSAGEAREAASNERILKQAAEIQARQRAAKAGGGAAR